jgi:hypothetical protein
MVFRAIIQINKATGERNLFLTRNMLLPREDFLVSCPHADEVIIDQAVEIYAPDEVLALIEAEYRGADNTEHLFESSVDITEQGAEGLRTMLEEMSQ